MADAYDTENQFKSWSENDEDLEFTKKRSKFHAKIQIFFKHRHGILLSDAGDDLSILVPSGNNLADPNKPTRPERRTTRNDKRNSKQSIVDPTGSRSTHMQSIVNPTGSRSTHFPSMVAGTGIESTLIQSIVDAVQNFSDSDRLIDCVDEPVDRVDKVRFTKKKHALKFLYGLLYKHQQNDCMSQQQDHRMDQLQDPHMDQLQDHQRQLRERGNRQKLCQVRQ